MNDIHLPESDNCDLSNNYQQLSLFTLERLEEVPSISPRWVKTYQSWRGEFELVRQRLVISKRGQKKPTTLYDFAIEVYDPTGEWVQTVELTSESTVASNKHFCDTVDRLLVDLGKLTAPEPALDQEHFYGKVTDEQVECVRPQLKTDLSDDQVHSVRPQLRNTVADEHTHWVGEYWVKRAGNKYYYFRYMWMDSGKKHCIHIGSVRSPRAQSKVEMVNEAIKCGTSPHSIQKMILSWSQSND